MIKNIKVGSDPEVFIKDSSGEFFPSVGLIGGTKDSPLPTEVEGIFVQEDNVLVEYNIPPASSADEFVTGIQTGIDVIQKRLPNGFYVEVVSSGEFNPKHLKSKQAKEFGCEPDYNIWTLSENEVCKSKATLRTGGGHIHVGGEGFTDNHKIRLVKAMDRRLGVASVILDNDTMRRTMYGKAGAFRNKPYGIEYRVLSNFWVKDERYTRWVYEETIRAVNDANSDVNLDEDAESIQAAINNSNIELAEQLLLKYNITLP
jgi:hypothetical protein